MNYLYQSQESKGELRLSLTDPETKKEIWHQCYPAFTEDVITGDLVEDLTLIDYGVMKSTYDTTGLQKHLQACGIIQATDTISLNPLSVKLPGMASSSVKLPEGVVLEDGGNVGDAEKKYTIEYLKKAFEAGNEMIWYDLEQTERGPKYESFEEWFKDSHFSEGGKPLGSTGLFEEGGSVADLSGPSKFFVESFIKNRIARKDLNKSNPKYQQQIDGLKEAVDKGYIFLEEKNDTTIVRAKQKLADLYKYESGGKPLGSTGLFEEGGKVGDIVVYAIPAIVYEKGQPKTIQSKKSGKILKIKPNGDLEVKSQAGDYHIVKPSELVDNNFADGGKPLGSTGLFEEGGIVTSDEMKSAIEKILEKVLPGFWHSVSPYKGFGAHNTLAIQAAAANKEMNGVSGQRAQCVSLSLDVDTMELAVQIYGGNGGSRIYRQPNKELREEKYLAMAGTKIPFRTPQKNKKAVLSAIQKFFENYKKALEENIDTLMWKEDVDYRKLLLGEFADGGILDLQNAVYAKGGEPGKPKNFVEFLELKGIKKFYKSNRPIARYDESGSRRLKNSEFDNLEKEYREKYPQNNDVKIYTEGYSPDDNVKKKSFNKGGSLGNNVDEQDIRILEREHSGYPGKDNFDETIGILRMSFYYVGNEIADKNYTHDVYYGLDKEEAESEMNSYVDDEHIHEEQHNSLKQKVAELNEEKVVEYQGLCETLSEEDFDEAFPSLKSVAEFVEYNLSDMEDIDGADVEAQKKNFEIAEEIKKQLEQDVRQLVSSMCQKKQEAGFTGSTFYGIYKYKDGYIQIRVGDHFFNPSNIMIGKNKPWLTIEPGSEHNEYENIYGYISINIINDLWPGNNRRQNEFKSDTNDKLSDIKSLKLPWLIDYETYDTDEFVDGEEMSDYIFESIKSDLNDKIESMKGEIDIALEMGLYDSDEADRY